MDSKLTKKVFSRIGLSLFVFLLLQQALTGTLAVLATNFAPEVTQSGWYLWVISYGPLYLVAFPVALFVLRTAPDGDSGPFGSAKLSAGQIALLALACFGIVYPLSLVSTLLNTLIAQLKGGDVLNPLEMMVTNSNPWVSLVVLSVVAPIMEELFFRGLLYKKLATFGGKTYILFSAAVFALFHCNLYQILYAFMLGVLFAAVTFHTGTIRYSIVLHVTVNFIGSGVSSLVLHYGGEPAIAVWGAVVIGLAVAGIATGVVLWKRNRARFHFEPGVTVTPGKGQMLLNPGMILFALLAVGLMVFTLLL